VNTDRQSALVRLIRHSRESGNQGTQTPAVAPDFRFRDGDDNPCRVRQAKMPDTVMVAAEGSNGVRPDSGCSHTALVRRAAAGGPPPSNRSIPEFWVAPVSILCQRIPSISAVKKILVVRREAIQTKGNFTYRFDNSNIEN